MPLFKDCGCGCNGQKQQEKFTISVISGLTFFVIANPETFRVVRRLIGPGIATPNGCPSTLGLIVHSVVFILVVWAMMNVKKIMPELPHNITGNKKNSEKKKPAPVAPPKNQVDMEMVPGMVDEPFVDTGLQLGSMDVNQTY